MADSKILLAISKTVYALSVSVRMTVDVFLRVIGNIVSTSTVQSDTTRLRKVEGDPQSDSTVTGDAYRIRNLSTSITSASDVDADSEAFDGLFDFGANLLKDFNGETLQAKR